MKEPFTGWGIVELMGHVRLAGYITEEQHFGGSIGRIEIPTRQGETVTHFFGAAAIYRLTPTTEDGARTIALSSTSPIKPWELRRFLPAPQITEDPEEPEDEESDCFLYGFPRHQCACREGE